MTNKIVNFEKVLVLPTGSAITPNTLYFLKIDEDTFGFYVSDEVGSVIKNIAAITMTKEQIDALGVDAGSLSGKLLSLPANPNTVALRTSTGGIAATAFGLPGGSANSVLRANGTDSPISKAEIDALLINASRLSGKILNIAAAADSVVARTSGGSIAATGFVVPSGSDNSVLRADGTNSPISKAEIDDLEVNAETLNGFNSSDFAAALNPDDNYVTDAEKVVIENTGGVNTGNETTSSIQSKRPLKTIKNLSLEGNGNVDLTKTMVGLGSVDNTSDANKPVSNATQIALDNKVGSVTTGEPTGSNKVPNMVSLTQAQYDAGTPISDTFYVITD